MIRILFLGDSITDSNHNFTLDNLGDGFVKDCSILLSQKSGQHPDAFSITNGGTDGLTLPRIYQKWQAFYADSTYDAVVINGGINDIGVILNTNRTEEQAQKLLSESIQSLQTLITELLKCGTSKILFLEPFLFPYPAHRLIWMPLLSKMQKNIKHVIRTFPQPFVQEISLHEELNRAAQEHLMQFTPDGIHLLSPGNQLLAQKVCDALTECFCFSKL